MQEMRLVVPERVSYSMNITIQIRQYEPLKTSVTLSKDVEKGKTRDETFQEIKKWVDSKSGEMFDKLTKMKKT